MTLLQSDNLIYQIDAFVETLEDEGYSIEEVVNALTEYTEIIKEIG